MKYRCIKGYTVEKYDADGFLMEGKYFTIPVGSVWEVDSEFPNIVGSTDCVHLDRVWKSKKAKSNQWIEVTKETLVEYFEPIEQKGE
jgi:hypothetical protein